MEASASDASEIEIQRPPRPIAGVMRPPGSKSITNRALLLAALAAGESTLSGCLESEDTEIMRAALARLGVRCDASEGGARVVVEGAGGPLRRVSDPATAIDVGTAGTAARFLCAALAGSPIEVLVDGSPRMRERPMAGLLEVLGEQGAELRYHGRPGALPVTIRGAAEGLRGGEIRLARPPSSQFISALILAAPLARAPTRIVLEGGTPARPYVDMSLAVLEAFGGRGRWEGEDTIVAEPGVLQGRAYAVEPDASAASYFLALAAIYGGEVTIPDLGRASLQGDAQIAWVLGRMGAEVEQGPDSTTLRSAGRLRGIDVDLGEMPDMTLTIAVAALHAEGTTRIRGVEILRHHESDRLAAGATELRKLGAEVEEEAGGLTITPPVAGIRRGVAINTYLDHRMAMAFALAGEVTIRDPGCVRKTFPGYFDVLAELAMVRRP
ncbi:MAG: 3-phosphoshikimate 1-carboxyvinyltransferase [Myxococcales bacterium]|nr:3-phosphoshikimate 1-carboxyvinyltransferase [Myxococcales bacterium]